MCSYVVTSFADFDGVTCDCREVQNLKSTMVLDHCVLFLSCEPVLETPNRLRLRPSEIVPSVELGCDFIRGPVTMVNLSVLSLKGYPANYHQIFHSWYVRLIRTLVEFHIPTPHLVQQYLNLVAYH